MGIEAIQERLAAGKVVFLDGGVGTELQKRGAPMNEHAWCALATETSPDILRALHEDYIRAGADIITANTFSSSRILLGPAGLGGRAARRGEDGRLVGYARESYPFAEVARRILAHGSEVVGIMHTNVDLTGAALDVLRQHSSGPLMAYPDSGHFKMPDWQFENVITPREFARECVGWVNAGVQVIGGCCGLSIEHIAAMTAELADRA